MSAQPFKHLSKYNGTACIQIRAVGKDWQPCFSQCHLDLARPSRRVGPGPSFHPRTGHLEAFHHLDKCFGTHPTQGHCMPLEATAIPEPPLSRYLTHKRQPVRAVPQIPDTYPLSSDPALWMVLAPTGPDVSRSGTIEVRAHGPFQRGVISRAMLEQTLFRRCCQAIAYHDIACVDGTDRAEDHIFRTVFVDERIGGRQKPWHWVNVQ